MESGLASDRERVACVDQHGVRHRNARAHSAPSAGQSPFVRSPGWMACHAAMHITPGAFTNSRPLLPSSGSFFCISLHQRMRSSARS
ncbi:MAG TPA: hypothetical protein VGF67_28315 [Ktedonobacteraceae bacterium]